jgi:hypothetical protein
VVRRSRTVDVSEVTLDGVVVLVVLVDTSGHIDVGGVRVIGSIIITGGTTDDSATASLAARRVRTAERRVSTEVDGRTRVDILVLQVDRVIILVVLVDISVGVDGNRSAEALATVVSRGATNDGGTLLMLASPAALEGSTPGREVWRRVDILVLHVNGVIILVVLVDISVGVDGNRSADALATVVSRGATHDGGTLLMLASPAALEGSTPGREVWRRVDILVLQVDGVIILAVLVHIGLEVASDWLAEANSLVVTGRTANDGATVGMREASRAVVRPTTGSTDDGTILFLGTPTLLKGRGRSIECCGGRTSGTAMVTMGRWVERRGRVDVLVLDSNGVIILVVVVHLRLEDAGDGHVKALALIVTRGATDNSAARRATLLERTHARDLGALLNNRGTEVEMGRRVHILVLQVDGVIILAVLVDLRVGLDIGSIGTGEATITVISRGTADNGGTGMGYEIMLLLYSSSAHMFVYR